MSDFRERPPPSHGRVAVMDMLLDQDSCYRALETRDARFDGRFFTGVVTTGIYCRPICPALTPKRRNCRFFPSAAAAQEAGFRPCLRCRPETAPHRGAWLGTSNTVSRALALIADGALDGEEASIAALAGRLGVGERQLRRLFRDHLGATPSSVAQTRRILLAKQLVHDTDLPLAEVALAAGFGSIRRFNETFRALFGRPPGALRRAKPAGSAVAGAEAEAGSEIVLQLRYRPPYDWPSMLDHLAARAIQGVERVGGGRYARSLRLDGLPGWIEVRHRPERQGLEARIALAEVRQLPGVVTRLRRLFDLEADVTAIGVQLAGDPLLAPLVAARPGLRVPGAWDMFELAVRAVLGQQVSVAAARRLGGTLARLCGPPLPDGGPDGLVLAFPGPAEVAAADLSALGMPAARRRTLQGLARAFLDDPGLSGSPASLEAGLDRLRRIPGIGDWTAHYIALRAWREPDAFPAGDVALLRASRCSDPAGLARRAEIWRPWRAYAAQHLWAADAAAPIFPEREPAHA